MNAERRLQINMPTRARIRSLKLPAHARLPDVVQAVCKAFMISEADLQGKSRRAYLVTARKITVLCLRELSRRPTLATVGIYLQRDHTSIMYLERHALELARKDQDFIKQLELVKTRIRGRIQ